MFNVLIAEDDKNLLKLINDVLKNNGYTVHCARNGNEALDIMDKVQIDLLITDVMMPDLDGYILTETLRECNYNLPVLMITAKDSFKDKEKGFLVGTDDYMVKPLDLGELLLRVTALLRRSKIASEQRLTIGNVTLDYNKLSIEYDNKINTLPPKEFYLLYKLLSYPEVIFTRMQLMDEIWGLETEVDERTVDVHIKRLRERLSIVNDFEIMTVRGLGYKAVKKQ